MRGSPGGSVFDTPFDDEPRLVHSGFYVPCSVLYSLYGCFVLYRRAFGNTVAVVASRTCGDQPIGLGTGGALIGISGFSVVSLQPSALITRLFRLRGYLEDIESRRDAMFDATSNPDTILFLFHIQFLI